jgi:hypothetical protein
MNCCAGELALDGAVKTNKSDRTAINAMKASLNKYPNSSKIKKNPSTPDLYSLEPLV